MQLAEMVGTNQLQGDCLVWRQGFAEWRPLASVRHEIGVPTVEIPSEAIPPSVAETDSDPDSPYAVPASALREPMKKEVRADDWKGRGTVAVFSQAFRILSENFWILMASYLVVWVPLNFALEYVNYFVIGPDDILRQMRLQLIAESFIGIIATGSVLVVCGAIWDRRQISFSEVIAGGFANWGRLWLARLLSGLCILAGAIFLILPGIWIAVRLSLVEPLVVSEKITWSKALQRSWDLSRENFWQIFGILVLGILLILLFAIVVGILLVVFPDLDSWWFTAIIECLLSPAIVIYEVLFFVVYKHLREDAC